MNKQVHKYIMTTLGCILLGVAVNAFYVPHHLLSGGIGGISVILYYLFNFSMGITSLIINIPLFILAYKYMEKDYIPSAFYGMLVFSFSLDFFKFLATPVILHDTLLSCIAGGALSGIGGALLYRVGGSSGGTDIIGAIVNKYYSISISTIGFLLNIVLMTFAAFLFGLEPALYTLFAFFVSFKTANAFTDGFDYKKSFMIISDHHEEIAQGIIEVVGRGVTYLEAEGAFTHQNRRVIFVVAKLTQVAKIRELIRNIDPKAFVIVQDVTDAFGKGFTLKGDSLERKIEENQ